MRDCPVLVFVDSPTHPRIDGGGSVVAWVQHDHTVLEPASDPDLYQVIHRPILSESAKALARIMAAGPELLGALEALLAEDETGAPDVGLSIADFEALATTRQARLAIAKARRTL